MTANQIRERVNEIAKEQDRDVRTALMDIFVADLLAIRGEREFPLPKSRGPEIKR